MAPRSNLRVIDPSHDDNPFKDPSEVDIPAQEDGVSFKDGILHVENDDGGVTIDFNPSLPDDDADTNWFKNLATSMGDSELGRIANELMEGIKVDEDSRREEMQTRERGIKLLGLRLEDPRGDIGSQSAPLEGMSTVHHPLLIEAVIRSQATLRGELLPAVGPVKVRNDTTVPPDTNPGQPPQTAGRDAGNRVEELGSALEKDLNHYLTVTATEYYPDTDRMLFRIPMFGDGYKKVYNDPLKRRPVSESVNAEDLIVSNAAVALADCGRVTHKMRLRKSVLRRMQIIGAYRDVELAQPSSYEGPNPVEKAKAAIQGVKPEPQRPEDKDYIIYECYCELDLDQYAPRKWKGKGIPLPYVVTLEENSRKVLMVRRNWEKEDDLCNTKQYFVQFPYIRGLGFYGIGLLHLLGNLTKALTAITREIIDAGMFANFPGSLHAKAAGRQLTNQLRVPPGGSIPIDLGVADDIRKVIMPLPYKDPGAVFVQFAQYLSEQAQRLGNTAHIPVAEGKQDAPVGSTLAMIEQATKVEDAVHKRLHAAQAEEFALLKMRFQEDPEAFWRHNPKPAIPWQKAQFLEALNNNNLVPVADPNNPTSLHRMAKAMGIKQLQQMSPDLYNPVAVDKRIFRIANIDPEGLFLDTPAPPPPDPRIMAVQQKAQTAAQQAQIQAAEVAIKAHTAQSESEDKAADRASRERLEQLKMQLEQMKIEREKVIHQQDLQMGQHELAAKQQEIQMDAQQKQQEMQLKHQGGLVDLHMAHQKAQHEVASSQMKAQHEQSFMQQSHQQELGHKEDIHEQDVELKKKQVEAAAKMKPKGGSDGSSDGK